MSQPKRRQNVPGTGWTDKPAAAAKRSQRGARRSGEAAGELPVIGLDLAADQAPGPGQPGEPGPEPVRPEPLDITDDQLPPGTVTLESLQPDQHNRRVRTSRNVAMLVEALQKVGASRSIVIDEHNEILAGNGVVEAAAALGIQNVRIIDAAGDTIIAVRRTGLTDGQKRDLAIYDNRTAELAEWNVEQLREDMANGLDLQPFFFEEELTALLKEAGAPGSFKSVDENVETEHTCPKCGYEWSGNG